ncbi:MAG TPA: Bax inhibitor-1/YccA family protein [Nakamurella sp.]
MQSSSNPAFRNMEKVIGSQQQAAPSAQYLDQMYQQPAYQAPARERFLTVDDVVTKTAMILVLAVVAGFATAWFQAYVLAIPGALIGFVLAMVIIFKRKISPPLIIGYALAEGVFLGAITGVFNQYYPGIAAQAIVGTLGVFGGMLVIYKTGAIRVTPRLTKMIIGGVVGVAVLMLFNLIMSMFGVNMGLRDGSTMAIIFSVICIALAAFSFLLDFDAIDKAIKQGAPANTAWYFAFGLMVTLVWLYLEILRLLGYARQ